LSSESTLDPLIITTTEPATTTLPPLDTMTTLATPATFVDAETSTTIPAATTIPVAPTIATIVAESVPAETTIPPAATLPPDTTPPTAPETTVPPTDAPPVTNPPTAGCIACQPNYVFAYPTHFAVPQLGTEPVRGTGCGADGSLGPTIPDGIWNGFITISSTAVKIDVECIYYGASAAPFIAACEQENSADDCLESGDDFWKVNNNPRTRSVPLDPSFRRRYESTDCADPGPGRGTAKASPEQDQFDSWLIIENGMATFALTSCVYG
jgi:hypothetical protein